MRLKSWINQYCNGWQVNFLDNARKLDGSKFEQGTVSRYTNNENIEVIGDGVYKKIGTVNPSPTLRKKMFGIVRERK